VLAWAAEDVFVVVFKRLEAHRTRVLFFFFLGPFARERKRRGRVGHCARHNTPLIQTQERRTRRENGERNGVYQTCV
jgi:hypothetical protein